MYKHVNKEDLKQQKIDLLESKIHNLELEVIGLKNIISESNDAIANLKKKLDSCNFLESKIKSGLVTPPRNGMVRNGASPMNVGTIVNTNEVVDDSTQGSMDVHQLMLLRNMGGDEQINPGLRSFPSWSFKTP